MTRPDYPLLVFVISFFMLWLSAGIGVSYQRRRRQLEEDVRKDLSVILAATLTLLALIIGFSFSMAVNRYDQRKQLEAEEANAIGTEYVRADLLPAADATRVHTLLIQYLDQRILFYMTSDKQKLAQINAHTAQLQTELWSAVTAPTTAQPTPTVTLAVWGMNDVLNSQGYTQAAWWNRIPIEAWVLMLVIAIFCNLLIGLNSRDTKSGPYLRLVIPLVVAISFFLIADIDSPSGGVIHVNSPNLISLSESLHARSAPNR